jgi:hypothetical protein
MNTREINLPQTIRDHINRDQIWHLKKGHFVHGVHKAVGGGGQGVTGGGDRAVAMMNPKVGSCTS